MRIGRTQTVIVAEPLVNPVPAPAAPVEEPAPPTPRADEAAPALLRHRGVPVVAHR